MLSFAVHVLILPIAVTLGATTCPAAWERRKGVCLWPKQQAYKNVSVAGSSDFGAACCAICSGDPACVSWLVYTREKGHAYPKGTCILNDHAIKGQAPAEPICISGLRPTPPSPPTPPPKPAPKGAKNVLFLAVDDLRPDLNAFGGPDAVPGTHTPKMHTPHIDALAAKSLVLTKNYVQQAVCSPTRTSLLTGRRPDRTRVYDLYSNFRTVGANYTTIPEFFKLNGYKSIGMGKIFHPGHASGAGAMGGSDDACCSWSNASAYFHAPNLGYWSGKAKSTGNGGAAWMAVPPDTEARFPLPDNQTADHAVGTLAQLQREYTDGDRRPFFLAVGFHKPHLPFVASEQFFAPYAGSAVSLPPDQQPPRGMPPVAWSSYGELRGYVDQARLNASGAPGSVLPKDDVLALRRAYYAAVTQTDAMVGRVIAALDATSFGRETVISFWGDHGWQLGEHGEWCKHTNFEFAARAPMMVHVPGLTDTAIVSSAYSEHVDLFPTLAEVAAGIKMESCPAGDASFKVPLCTEGSSLAPLMNGAAAVKHAAFSQYPRGYQKSPDRAGRELFDGLGASTSPCIQKDGRGCTMGYTVVTRLEGHEYRYTEWADFNTHGFAFKVNWDRNVGVELYNHTADPGENFNLNSTSTSAAVHALSAQLSRLLRSGPNTAELL